MMQATMLEARLVLSCVTRWLESGPGMVDAVRLKALWAQREAMASEIASTQEASGLEMLEISRAVVASTLAGAHRCGACGGEAYRDVDWPLGPVDRAHVRDLLTDHGQLLGQFATQEATYVDVSAWEAGPGGPICAHRFLRRQMVVLDDWIAELEGAHWIALPEAFRCFRGPGGVRVAGSGPGVPRMH